MLNRDKSHYYSHIRDLSRRVFKNSGKSRVCRHCGYDKHVEISHIHAISKFPKTTSISIVNDPENLIALCRNCHWELDYMDLTIEDILTSCNG